MNTKKRPKMKAACAHAAFILRFSSPKSCSHSRGETIFKNNYFFKDQPDNCLAAFGIGMPQAMKEPSTTCKTNGMPTMGKTCWKPQGLEPHNQGDAPALSPATSVGCNTFFRAAGTHFIALYSSLSFVRIPIVPVCSTSLPCKRVINFAVLRGTLSPKADTSNDGGSPSCVP